MRQPNRRRFLLCPGLSHSCVCREIEIQVGTLSDSIGEHQTAPTALSNNIGLGYLDNIWKSSGSIESTLSSDQVLPAFNSIVSS